MTDLRHPLAVLASRMPWQEIEARVAQVFSRKGGVGVVARWADTPRWQFFSGCADYEDRLPCDAITLVKFRQLLGEEGVEELPRVIVDSTVQHKAIAHPTDSCLQREIERKASAVGAAVRQALTS